MKVCTEFVVKLTETHTPDIRVVMVYSSTNSITYQCQVSRFGLAVRR